MQTTKRSTGLRTAAPDYETLVQQAINKVSGFDQLYKELERTINVTGKSQRVSFWPSFAPEEIKQLAINKFQPKSVLQAPLRQLSHNSQRLLKG